MVMPRDNVDDRNPVASESDIGQSTSFPLKSMLSLLSIKFEAFDLEHTHPLVIEKDSGRPFGFGENEQG